ncbi:MAG: hypothetical protein Q4G33_04680 [bacterium]|nr:hypothetical protein [bacterium]
MNVKKRITGLMALALAASSVAGLAGCGNINTGVSYEENGKKIYAYKFNMYTQDDTKYPETHDNAFDETLKEKFNMYLDYDRIPRTDWETKTNTYFATGDAPDITTGGKEPNYKGWAEDGQLMPVADSLEDLKEKLPNYVKLFGENLEDVYNLSASADGKLYYLPSLRQEKAQMCWLYRQDIVDPILEELGMKEFPKTTDEFLLLCKTIKEKYPDKIVISSNGQKKSSLTGFFQAFGMPELILSEYSYVERDGSFVPYALTTDNARKMYSFLKELHDMGAIDNEILSLEKDKFYSRCATDNAVITYNYVYNADTFTSKTNVNGKTGGKWTYTSNMLTNDPARGTVFKKDPAYSNWGPAFATSCDSEPGKFDRALDLYDFFASKAGQLYSTYGIEGESYNLMTIDEYKDTEKAKIDKKVADGKTTEEKAAAEKQKIDDFVVPEDWKVTKDDFTYHGRSEFDGIVFSEPSRELEDGVEYVPVVADGWYHQNDNSKGTKINEKLGMFSQVFIKYPKLFYENRGKQIEGLYKEFMEKVENDNYYYIESVPMRYTQDEQDSMTDLETSLATKRDEYMARFLLGNMDPENDADWNKYISDMKRVGLEKFENLQTTVYNRTKADLEK